MVWSQKRLGGTYQYPVIELHSRRILKDVLQHRGEGEEIVWDPALPHLGEGVVHKACIQSCHKGTCIPESRVRG